MANEYLQSALQAAGLTVEQFADIIEVDPKSVQRWVTGNTTPYPRHRARIAVALNLSEQNLWPGQTPEPTPAATAQTLKTPPMVGGVVSAWAHADQDGAPDLAAFINRGTGPIDVLDSSCQIQITTQVTDALLEQAGAGRVVRVLTDGREPRWEPLLDEPQIKLYLAEIPGEYWLIKTPDRMLLAINLEHEPAGSPPPPLLELNATSSEDCLFRRLAEKFDELWQLADDTQASQPDEPPRSNPSEDTAHPARSTGRRWPNQPN
jgi:transcriptional regulator with XRE-family HTH domain